ncbi:E3 ubiquitin-protein ligase UPL5-like [Papaver somniferum]|uniref:E3 ubiquitin-protein ligase UPL5-like n=1 Tax=Papaver somniferum TaxID=3469 RepID=UPI000E70387A|nr:E3 ubiquitin-protein ligase UPL5-like [Papaver somniferum]
MAMLIIYSKRSGEHQWILEYRNLIDARFRRWLVTRMFPKVNFYTEKQHSVLIDRSQLLRASSEQIAHASPKLLRSCLEVEFEHETASGPGVLREWIFLVCQELFHPDNSLFLACPSDRRRFFPNPVTLDQRRLKYFTFCGQVIALALMYKVQVGIAFVFFFKQLSREAVSLEDVRYADPCLYNSCKRILEMDADLVDSDMMGLTFINETQEFGFKRVVELCPGGEAIAVNSNNREEYIRLLIQNCFVKPMSDKIAYFARGISIEDWKAHTDYNDYDELDDPICWFWKVVEGMSAEQQRGLLYFWTSVRYLSVKGFSSLESRLCICKTSSSPFHLPSSHTCVYSLDLPHYPSLDVMEERLLLICRDYACYSFGNY